MHDIIMAPTDGTGFDRDAIAVATKLSNIAGSQLKLVRVYSAPMVFAGPDSIAYPREALEKEREWELSQLNALAAECRSETRAEVSSALEEGPVADALLRFARLHDVNLIVMSSHGRGGFARATLGSVTDRLIRETSIPVLVVKPSPNYLRPDEAKLFRRIVVPLDGSRLAEEIIPQVIELASRNDSSVTLVTILIPRTYSQQQIEDSQMPWWEDDISVAQTYLGEQAERIRAAGVPASIEITIGDDVADSIMRSAARLRADLVAIGTRGRGGFARMMRGSVADKVVRTSRTSLLVFHPRSPAKVMTTAEAKERAAMGFVPAA